MSLFTVQVIAIVLQLVSLVAIVALGVKLIVLAIRWNP